MGSLSESGVLFLGMANQPDAAQIMSPCISVCKMSTQTGLCLGCHRTLDEIARWSEMSDNQRRLIMQQLKQRAAQHAVQPRSAS